MSWERNTLLVKALSPAPSLFRWLIAGFLSLIVSALLFIAHASTMSAALSGTNVWFISSIPAAGWLLLFMGRCYLWFREVNHYAFLQEEAQHSQQVCEQWAQRYIAVIASTVILPDNFSARAIGQERVQQYGLVRRIDLSAGREMTSISAIRLLIAALESHLNRVASVLPLRVTIVTDQLEETLADDFCSVWQEYIAQPIIRETLLMTDALSLSVLEERLKNPMLTADFVVVLQLSGGQRYSDGLAALLLTSDDVANKYHLSHSARLLRPMSLDMNCFDSDLRVFLQTQVSACRTQHILGDVKAWNKYFAQLMAIGTAFGTAWQPEENELLEKWCGKPGPLSSWLLTALAADWISLHRQSVLTLFSSAQEHFISTIMPGIEDEYTG
ncbi:type VI secretion protein [Cronobacter dublinensis]|uniref:type VI secretion protein n=1 Tax=Cronobacter dublinensis TaxID=413497 RepID=UPI001411CC55|nr:type VI secretion protein [Cronobacter dublinensis]NHV91373.1 type VI secretion protein [Cronobacter dublinensis]